MIDENYLRSRSRAFSDLTARPLAFSRCLHRPQAAISEAGSPCATRELHARRGATRVPGRGLLLHGHPLARTGRSPALRSQVRQRRRIGGVGYCRKAARSPSWITLLLTCAWLTHVSLRFMSLFPTPGAVTVPHARQPSSAREPSRVSRQDREREVEALERLLIRCQPPRSRDRRSTSITSTSHVDRDGGP